HGSRARRPDGGRDPAADARARPARAARPPPRRNAAPRRESRRLEDAGVARHADRGRLSPAARPPEALERAIESALALVIPVHGEGAELRASLDSLARADLPQRMHTIVVDAGS